MATGRTAAVTAVFRGRHPEIQTVASTAATMASSTQEIAFIARPPPRSQAQHNQS
jgi:hypothetical protein